MINNIQLICRFKLKEEEEQKIVFANRSRVACVILRGSRIFILQKINILQLNTDVECAYQILLLFQGIWILKR